MQLHKRNNFTYVVLARIQSVQLQNDALDSNVRSRTNGEYTSTAKSAYQKQMQLFDWRFVQNKVPSAAMPTAHNVTYGGWPK